MDVVFFPRKDYDVVVCDHRLGKRMTFTEQSDQLKLTDSYDWIVGLGKTNGVKVGFFALYSEMYSGDFTKARNDLNSGDIWIDQYSFTPELATKIAGGQTITPEEFEASYENTLLPAFLSALGKKPTALSYSYGNQTFKDATCPLYLAGRNSGGASTYGGTDYGLGLGTPADVPYSFDAYKSRSSTIRWYDRAVGDSSFAAKIAKVAEFIDAALLNGGWVSNFTHFHSVVSDGNQAEYQTYMAMLSGKNANDEIYFAGYGEAVAYLVYRQLVTKAVMYSPVMDSDSLVIRLDARNTLGVDTDLLQVPISVKFSTVGTPLAGQTIKSNRNLISLGSGEYIVEIPYADFPVAKIEKV